MLTQQLHHFIALRRAHLQHDTDFFIEQGLEAQLIPPCTDLSRPVLAVAMIGAAVKNAANETVGTVSDVYVDTNGAIKQVVVSVGGFLGLGARYVAVPWQDIKSSRDGNSLLLKTNWTKESLKAMPEYKYERRAMATPAGQKN